MRRLHSHTRELNAKLRALKQQLELVNEPPSHVTEVIKSRRKTKYSAQRIYHLAQNSTDQSGSAGVSHAG